MKLSIGSIAPDFELLDQEGNLHTLHDYKGKYILIYFYPKDNTPGCTKEACKIRDSFSGFQQYNAVVLGISTDSVKSHLSFSTKFHLPFPLLADEQKRIVDLYGVWGKKKFMGKEYMGTNRTSFLIDPEGIIIKIYDQVKPETHAEEVLKDIQSLP